MNDLLTRLEKAGGSGILPRSASMKEREALALHLGALRAAGHGVMADEVMENGEPTGEIRIMHYLSCKRCKGVR